MRKNYDVAAAEPFVAAQLMATTASYNKKQNIECHATKQHVIKQNMLSSEQRISRQVDQKQSAGDKLMRLTITCVCTLET
jgi:hypothetical protein